MMVHAGPARVFEQEETALAAIFGGRDPAGRRGRDPLRGPQGRPGDARAAPADLGDHRHGSGQLGGPDHRRALFRRDAGRLHRPRDARGVPGRADRPGGGGGYDPHRHPRRAGRPGRARGCPGRARRHAGSLPSARAWKRARCWSATAAWWARRFVGRDSSSHRGGERRVADSAGAFNETGVLDIKEGDP